MPGWYPDLEQLRRDAKRLLRAAQAGDSEALARLARSDRPPRLADAQHAIAVAIGFASWPAAVRAIKDDQSSGGSREVRTELLLVRHSRRVQDDRHAQHTASGLDATGRSQARALAQRLAAELPADTVIMSSLRPPAIETAREIAEALRLAEPEGTCDLCGIHPGEAEGLTTAERVARYGPNSSFVPGAETWESFQPRVGPALVALADRFAGQTIVAVTEPPFPQASLVGLGGMGWRQAALGHVEHGSITRWSRLEEGDVRRVGFWRLDAYNDVGHLR